MRTLFLGVLFAFAPSGETESFVVTRAPEPSELTRLWPEGAPPPPATLLPYKKTEYGQYLVIMGGRDFHSVAHRSVGHAVEFAAGDRQRNGNNEFPWAVPGGLEGARDWESIVGIALPAGSRVRYWSERIEAGASRPLPKVFWSFPLGTRVYDLLTYRGKAFELRMLKKERERWVGRTLWQGENWPPEYRGMSKSSPPPHLRTTGNACTDCHSRAGQWERYGPLLRGNDFIFSWSAFQEGTARIDRTKPVKHWDEE